MHIKPSDGATQTRPSSIRPAALSAPAAEAAPSLVNLSISSEVRALSTLLSQALPELGPLHLLDVLTPQDRLMLARAVQFVADQGIGLSELRKLVIDLGLYRLQAAAKPPLGPSAEPIATPDRPALGRAPTETHTQAVRAWPLDAAERVGQPEPAARAWPLAPAPEAARTIVPLGSAPDALASAALRLAAALAPQEEEPRSPLERALLDALRAAPASPLTAQEPSQDGPEFEAGSGVGAPLRAFATALQAPNPEPATPYSTPPSPPQPTRAVSPLVPEVAARGLLAPTPGTQAGPQPVSPPWTHAVLPAATLDARARGAVAAGGNWDGGLASLAARASMSSDARVPTPALTPLELALSAALSSAPTRRPSDDIPSAGALRPLPLFSPRDEQLARAILGSLALQDTLVDPNFVRALLDPDRTPAHAVDLGFLRQLVIALSANHTDGASDARVSGERREARALLSQAVERLSAALGELPALSELDLAEGAARLRQRWPALLSSARAQRAPAASGQELAEALEQPLPLPTSRAGQAGARPGPTAPATRFERADRALLGLLYAAAKGEGDLENVDRVALALHALRAAERREPASPRAQPPVRASIPPAPAAPARGPGPMRGVQARAGQQAAQATPGGDQPLAPGGNAAPALPASPRNASEPERHAAQAAPAERSVQEPPSAPSRSAADVPAPSDARGADPLQAHAPVPRSAEPHARTESRAGSPAWEAATPASSGHELARGMPDSTRSYGSSSQLAARVAGSYARIASESAFPPAGAARGNAGLVQTSSAPPLGTRPALDAARELAPAPLPTLTRPLNAAEALGVSSLVRELKARALRTARLRKRHIGASNVRPLEGLREAAYDAEADDPVLDAAPRRRRVRWHLLLERRKRRRTKER